jgi:hypothetical protein
LRRSIVVIAAFLLGLGFAAPAFAAPGDTGPSGSTFTDGQVTCGHDNTFLDAPIVAYNGGRGAEVCSDSGPVQGRVIARHTVGFFTIDYVEVDGDADNPEPFQGVLLFLPVGLP